MAVSAGDRLVLDLGGRMLSVKLLVGLEVCLRVVFISVPGWRVGPAATVSTSKIIWVVWNMVIRERKVGCTIGF